MKRNTHLHIISVLILAALVFGFGFGNVSAEDVKPGAEPTVTVYKTPTCGCCQAWVDYLKSNGFNVEAHNLDNLSAVKARHGLTEPALMSCHTAIIDGYVVEGHVPVNDIRRLLTERPDVIGITAPGMPQMSPGMSSIEPQGYDVLSFDRQGQVELFSRY